MFERFLLALFLSVNTITLKKEMTSLSTKSKRSLKKACIKRAKHSTILSEKLTYEE